MSTTPVNPGSEPEKTAPETAKTAAPRKQRVVARAPDTPEPEPADTAEDDSGEVELEGQPTEPEGSEEPEEAVPVATAPVEEKAIPPARIETKPPKPPAARGDEPLTNAPATKSGAALMRFPLKKRKRR